jgi:bacillithiol system protein YtxJ
MNWLTLDSPKGVEDIIARSKERPQLVFKHSTRCSISHMAKSRLERGPVSADIDYHYLDLLQFRPLSNQIAEIFQVHHESPQILLIRNGECIYEESHNGIDPQEIISQGV